MTAGVGHPVPDVVADAYVRDALEPRPLSLAQYRGSWLVLVFYPRDFTFVCPTELQALAALEPEFAASGVVVVAASTDSFYSHKAWFESDSRLLGAGYPVVADTAHELWSFAARRSGVAGDLRDRSRRDRPACDRQRPKRRPQRRGDAARRAGAADR